MSLYNKYLVPAYINSKFSGNFSYYILFTKI